MSIGTLEEIRDRLKLMQEDIKEIKQEITIQGKQLAVSTHIINEHERRSTQLEERFKPIEDNYKFQHKAMIVLSGASGVIGAIMTLVSVFKR